MGPYDGIVGAAVDRIGRNQIDVLLTGRLMKDTGRALITQTHTGPWDLNDDTDETRFSMEALGAQMELRAIQRRNRNSTKRMREHGRPKNKNSYGYRYVRLVPNGAVDHVEVDQAAAEIIRNVAERILGDESGMITPSTEAVRLTRAGVPNPSDHRAQLYGRPTKGLPWRPKVLIGILKSESALGYLMHNGKPVLNEEAHPIRLAEPLWDQATRKALIKKLKPKRTATGRAPRTTALLTGIAFCGNCGHRLYINGAAATHSSNGPVSYACRARLMGLVSETECKPSPAMSVHNLNALVEATFLEKVGTLPLYRRVYDAGTGHAARIIDLETDRSRLQEDRDAGLYDDPERAKWFRTRSLAMTAEIRQLKALPERPAGMYWQLTGETVADQWRTATDDAARRELLAFYDFRVVLFPRTSPVRVHIHNLDPTNEDAERRASWEAHELAIETEKQFRAQAEADQAKADQAEADAQTNTAADKQDLPAVTDALADTAADKQDLPAVTEALADTAADKQDAPAVTEALADTAADKQDPPAPAEQAAGFWTGRPADDETEPDEAA